MAVCLAETYAENTAYVRNYDEVVSLTCPHYDALHNSLAKAFKKHFEKELGLIRVLELGTGTGKTTRTILSCYDRSVVFSVDKNELLLEKARKNLASEIKAGKVKLIPSACLEYLRSAPCNYFDCFASAFTLHNFDESYRSQVIPLIYRALKPGALFVNADKYALDDVDSHKKTLAWQIALTEEKLEDKVLREATKEHFLEDDFPKRIMHEGQAKEFMRSLGFANVETTYREKMEAVVVGEKPK